jgi:hypothetical protein
MNDTPMCYGAETALPARSIRAAHFFDRDSTTCRCGARTRDLRNSPGHALPGDEDR